MPGCVPVGVERKAFGEMPERVPETASEDPREPGPVFGLSEVPVGLLEVIVAEEALITSSKRPQVRTGVSMRDPVLPQAVEALHGGVAAGLPFGDEEYVDAQEEMEADDLGEAVTIASPSGSGHLVIELGGLWNTHKAPRGNKMPAERDRPFIDELAGDDRMSCHIHRVEGEEPGDPARPAEMSRADKVGLMEISHPFGPEVGIRRPVRCPFRLAPSGLARPDQDPLDRRDGRDVSNPPLAEFPVDGLRADTREGGTTGLMSDQLVPDGDDPLNHPIGRLLPDALGRTVSVPEPFKTLSPVSLKPLAEPTAAPVDLFQGLLKTARFFMDPNNLSANRIFRSIVHRLLLLPIRFGRSVGDSLKSSRCCDGNPLGIQLK